MSNERPAPIIRPGELTRDQAAELNRGAAMNARHARVTATPPIMLHDSASGILLTADVEEEEVIVGKGRKKEAKKRQRVIRHAVVLDEVVPVRRQHKRPGRGSKQIRVVPMSFTLGGQFSPPPGSPVPAGSSVLQPLYVPSVPLHDPGSLADPVYGVPLGTLDGAISPADTVISVPEYASFPEEAPFDVRIGDEVLTVVGGADELGTLNASIDSDDTLLTVTGYENFPGTDGFQVMIGTETLTVTSGAGSPTWTVTRGPSPSPHTSGDAISLIANEITGPTWAVTRGSPAASHDDGDPVSLITGDTTSRLTFDADTAGTYLVAVSNVRIERTLLTTEQNPEDHYLALDLLINGTDLEELGRVYLVSNGASLVGEGCGWAVLAFAAGDYLELYVRNEFATITVSPAVGSIDPTFFSQLILERLDA